MYLTKVCEIFSFIRLKLKINIKMQKVIAYFWYYLALSIKMNHFLFNFSKLYLKIWRNYSLTSMIKDRKLKKKNTLYLSENLIICKTDI